MEKYGRDDISIYKTRFTNMYFFAKGEWGQSSNKQAQSLDGSAIVWSSLRVCFLLIDPCPCDVRVCLFVRVCRPGRQACDCDEACLPGQGREDRRHPHHRNGRGRDDAGIRCGTQGRREKQRAGAAAVDECAGSAVALRGSSLICCCVACLRCIASSLRADGRHQEAAGLVRGHPPDRRRGARHHARSAEELALKKKNTRERARTHRLVTPAAALPAP